MSASRLKQQLTEVPGSILLRERAFDPNYTKWSVTAYNDAYVAITREQETLYVERATLQVKKDPTQQTIWHYEVVWTTGLPAFDEKSLGKLHAMIDGLKYDQYLVMIDVRKDSATDGGFPVISCDGQPILQTKEGSPVLATLPFKPKTGSKTVLAVINRVANNENALEIEECNHFEFSCPYDVLLDLTNERNEGALGPFNSWKICDQDAFEWMWGYHLEAYLPNRLIAYSARTTDDPMSQETALTVMTHEGQKLYYVDAIDDHFYGTDLEPGIHVGENAAWFDAGEDGAELEVEWRPATKTDLESFGLSVEDVTEAMRCLDDDTDEDIVEQKAQQLVNSLPNGT